MAEKKVRIGKVKLGADIVRDSMDQMYDIMAILRLVPVRAEHVFYDRAIHITGFSPLFDESPEFCIPPEYEIEVETDRGLEDGIVRVLNVSVLRVDELAHSLKLQPEQRDHAAE